MQTESLNKVYPLTSSVPFDCIVKGKKLKAYLVAEEENGIQAIYHVSFSDGHKGVFYASDETPEWFEVGNKNSLYSKAIEEDLDAFSLFNRKKPPICLPVSAGENVFNLWVVPSPYDEPGEEKYSVHYNGDFRFNILKTEAGISFTTVERHKDYINQDIARIVKEHLLKHSAHVQSDVQ